MTKKLLFIICLSISHNYINAATIVQNPSFAKVYLPEKLRASIKFIYNIADPKDLSDSLRLFVDALEKDEKISSRDTIKKVIEESVAILKKFKHHFIEKSHFLLISDYLKSYVKNLHNSNIMQTRSGKIGHLDEQKLLISDDEFLKVITYNEEAIMRGCSAESKWGCQDDVEFSTCPCGPRGPRGPRGHRGHRGATGAFNSSSCVDICANTLVVNNCMLSLCVDRLSAVDEVVSGTFSAVDVVASGSLSSCDVIVGCDLFLNDSIDLAIGNVIKNGARFIHTFPGVGAENTFVGTNAGNFSTTGGGNHGFGFNALTNVADGFSNVAVGDRALEADTSGISNVAVGTFALNANTTGNYNTAVGDFALGENTTGAFNTAIGSSALIFNTTGIFNTAVGHSALQNNTSGSNNTGVGVEVLINCITGGNNTALGQNAWSSGSFNVMIGADAGNDGSQNVGVGYAVLPGAESDNNVAIGYNALNSTSSTNGNNTAVGYQALLNAQGGFNIAIGSNAGINSLGGGSSNNIYIGNDGADESAAIRIGTLGTHASCFVQGINGVTTGLSAVAVLVDGNGQLGTISSSRTLKHNIQDMNDESNNIYQLRPVTFAYNSDASETKQYGLIAEEVDEVFPAIVVHDQDGQPYTVQYQVLPVLLLNEVIKQKVMIENINGRLAALESQN